MSQATLMLDTNVLVDFLCKREPRYEKTRLLMILGRLGCLVLWMHTSQFTVLIYILSEGGKQSKMESALERLRGVRSFIRVFPVSEREIDLILSTSWNDPEDALIFESALAIKADAIVTNNKKDFENNLIKAIDCEQLFDWLSTDHHLTYTEIKI